MKYITTHEKLLKLHGKKVKCKIKDEQIDDAKICVEGGWIFICQNEKDGYNCTDKLGYKYSWVISKPNDKYEKDDGKDCTEIELIEKTLDDLEVGDILIDRDGDFRRVLGVCGEIVFLSRYTNDIESELLKNFGYEYTIYDLKRFGYSVYIPESESNTKKKELLVKAEEFINKAEELKFESGELIKKAQEFKSEAERL